MPNKTTTLVRPREPMAVEYEGFTQVFNPERILESDHPLVKQFPDRFEPVAPHPVDRVEQATAEPGELRNR